MKKRADQALASFFHRKLRKSKQPAKRRGSGLSIEALEKREVMAAAFFAPPEPTGSVPVQLVPLANVAAGTPEVVTFGVPFTRGSITPSQLSQLRVLKNGVEIPAFVEQLTPWRSIDDAGIDGQSVRVARIQIAYTFTTLNPESITVEWGGAARMQNRPALQDPRLEWHTVTSGTYVAADNVQEPDVLPVLPKAYMAKGMLDARTDPTNGTVAETRDDPAVADAMTFTGYTEYDNAQKNFFYTINNQNPGITVNYKTDPEPWLYDRASGMYELYLRSGFATALREAVRNADFYADHLDSSGFFTLKPGDPKYAYNESLAYTYWLLGDSRMLAPISTVVNAHSGTNTHWTPNLSFFTERNVGYKLLANEMAYEVTGNANFKNSVQTIIGDLIWHQNGAGGQLPANRIDGGLYHTGEQHDISEASSGSVLIASSWMSALIADPMVRAYGVWQNPQIADFMVRLGNFEKAASKTDADGQFGGTTRYPDYLMRADGTSDNRSDTDVQHAMDVGAVAAWATYFAELRGTPDASLRQLANDLYATYDVGVNFWTRPGGTNFNVSPPRRYTWEYKNSTSFSWSLTGTDAVGQPGNLQFSAATYYANENQGAIVITVARSGGGSGSVSVNYATTNGTATAGSDYTATSGTLTFADGQTSATFSIPLLNDTDIENAETVTLTLSNPTGGAALSSPASAVLTITSDDASNQPTTVTLQQGVNGYAGTTDANISTQYGQYNGGNGTTTVNGTQMGVYQLTGTGGYSMESLIRFSDLGITSGGGANAMVSGAKLTLSVDTWVNNPTIRGYYVAAPWTTAPGSDLGWLRRGTGQNWNTPGALGQGTDVIAGKSFVLPGITARGAQSITVDLDPAVVQSWIHNPNSNQGILLVNETTGAVVLVNASENATQSVRPKLSITYTVASSSNAGALQFSNAAYAVNETGGNATITVTRSGGSTGAVSIDYATANGTATAGSDYTPASGTLNFAAGETTKTFTIPILNDALVEGLETIQLTLSNPTGGATLGSQATATLTITSDDVAQSSVLQFSAANYAINENQGTATITVTRSGDSSAAVSVNYATSNGTASAGTDYTAASGTLNFAIGQTTATFTVPILNDSAVENSETINLTLSNPSSGATLGSQATATLTITSDDVALSGVLQFSSATYVVNETQSSATITVTRTGGSDAAVSVNYATSNASATAGSDYTAASGTLNFAIGQTSANFTISIINDTAVESPETVIVTLSNPTNGATLGSPASATLTINSEDTGSQPNTVTLQQGVNGYFGTSDVSISTQYAQYTGGNGTTSFGSAQLNVYQTVGTGGYTMESLIRFSNLGVSPSAVVSSATLTLNVDTWDVSPTIRGYYVLAPWNSLPGSGNQLGWLHRGTGQDWATPGGLGQGTDVVADKSFVLAGIRAIGGQTITVNLDPTVVQSWINNPDSNQGVLLVNETAGKIVRIGASESSNVALRPKLTINFAGDPPAPQPGAFAFSSAAYNVNEGTSTATITVTRIGGSSGAVSVNYATSNGTATAGNDYTASSGVLNFAAGETTKSFTIPITNDATVEGSETINLALSNPTNGATLGSQNTALLTIQDDDVAVPPPTGSFTKVNVASGIDAIIAQKYQEDPNWWLTGQHLIDLDSDGDLDLFLDAHVGSAVVALNDGQGHFTRATSGTWPTSEIHQMADINNDGKLDISVTYQDGGAQWWLNNSTPGNVNFTATNVTRGGNSSRAQVLFDFNGDGKLDWLRSEQPGLVIDFGNGSGGFTAGSLSFPIPGTTTNENANFLPGDYDLDGDIDLLIMTGGGYDGTTGKTFYWRNNGNQTFTDLTASAGLPANGTVAKGVGDFDQDGDLDLIALENKAMPPVIYTNDGQGHFAKKSGAIGGVGSGSLDYSAWGTAVTTDIDNDGIADIIMDGKYFLKVLRGTGGGNFTYMNNAWGIQDTAASAVDDGLCFGDIDADGDLDVIGFNEIFPSRTLNVYRNDLAAKNWLNVRPVGLAGNAAAAGATISLYAPGTNQLLWAEQVAQYDFQVATSYYGASKTERHFGLGDRGTVDVVVRFASGKTTRMNGVSANQTIELLESAGN
jgi:hypothetical protein